MISYDIMCMSEFVLFNNMIIFVHLFGKTAKLLLSIMIWVEETEPRVEPGHPFPLVPSLPHLLLFFIFPFSQWQ